MLTATPVPPTDPYLSVSQIVTLLPAGRGSDRIHPATVVRWIYDGVRTVTGGRVRLVATRLGSRWMIRRSDLEAFIEAQKPQFDAPAAPRAPNQRARASAAAERQLVEAGI